jgi:signal recognition particle subunit SEC65
LLTLEPVKEIGERSSRTVTKRKTVASPFCKYIIDYVEELRRLGVEPKDWLFPRFSYFAQRFLFDAERPLTIQRFDQILQRLDPSITSATFRYGGTEKFLRLGYTPYELKEIGDWQSSHMPEIYAARKGLTPSQKKFAEDTRET